MNKPRESPGPGEGTREQLSSQLVTKGLSRRMLNKLTLYVFPPSPFLSQNDLVCSIYSSNFHAVKREPDGTPGVLASLENERQIYKSVLEGGDIPLQGLSGLKRPSSSASTKGNGQAADCRHLSPTCLSPECWQRTDLQQQGTALPIQVHVQALEPSYAPSPIFLPAIFLSGINGPHHQLQPCSL